MNGKAAKYLRSLVSFVPSSPREYKNTTMKTLMVDTGRIDEKGNTIMRPEARVTTNVVGERVVYNRVKKAYKS